MTAVTRRERIIALGALSAMGEATLRLYAEEGARLVLVGRQEDRLKSLAQDLEARGAKSAVVCRSISSAAPTRAPSSPA